SLLKSDESIPGRGESAGVFDVNLNVKFLAAIRQLESLNHVQLLCMRRAVTIQRTFVIKSDRIDDERVAILVMSDRLPVPVVTGILAVRHVEINSADLRI